MCEQAGTGFRMMQREWQSLGHPAPVMRNDRAHKAFELFVPGLDKEVDMASDLIKAMFGKMGKTQERGTEQVTDQVAGEVTGEVTGEVSRLLHALKERSLGRTELQLALGLKGQANFRDRYILPALNAGFIERTIPDKPNSRLRKYRLTRKGVIYVKASK